MIAKCILAGCMALLLAAFFAFVGWNKACAPLVDLARYHAWTVFVPEPLGRAIGWSEVLLAGGLCTSLWPSLHRVARIAALALVLNQIIAAIVHASHGETEALPQNGVLIVLLIAVVLLLRSSVSTHPKEESL